jgi:hypothetical protein
MVTILLWERSALMSKGRNLKKKKRKTNVKLIYDAFTEEREAPDDKRDRPIGL